MFEMMPNPQNTQGIGLYGVAHKVTAKYKISDGTRDGRLGYIDADQGEVS